MKKILICDDEPDVVETLAQILELTYEDAIAITKFTDSIDALIDITEKKFDLILTDYKMPKLDGVELLNNMYSIKSSMNKETPVFIITGNAQDIDHPIIEERNITLVLKPVKSDKLLSLIDEVLEL